MARANYFPPPPKFFCASHFGVGDNLDEVHPSASNPL
jgi:hypothetical protein